ncbi:reverse transcriptase [Tanacetum coccineum]
MIEDFTRIMQAHLDRKIGSEIVKYNQGFIHTLNTSPPPLQNHLPDLAHPYLDFLVPKQGGVYTEGEHLQASYSFKLHSSNFLSIDVKELIRKGCKWNIGDGHNVNAWEDYWLEDHRRLGPKLHNCEVIYVRDFLNVDGDDWNRELLKSLFPNNVANQISCCFVNQSRPDTLYWLNILGGHFSSKLAYFLALDSANEIEQNITQERIRLWRALWKENVPNKIKLCVWRALQNYVPAIENMQIRGLTLTSLNCTHCGEFGEDVMHILYKCSMAKEVWIRSTFGYEGNDPDTLEEFCCMILENSFLSWEKFIMIL